MNKYEYERFKMKSEKNQQKIDKISEKDSNIKLKEYHLENQDDFK